MRCYPWTSEGAALFPNSHRPERLADVRPSALLGDRFSARKTVRVEDGRSQYPDRDPNAYRDVARTQLQDQLDSVESIGGRIDTIFGWAVGVLAVLIAVLALKHGPFNAATVAGMICAAVGFVSVASLTLVESQGSTYKIGATAQGVWEDFQSDIDDSRIAWRIAVSYHDAHTQNEPRRLRQLRRLRWMVPGLVVETMGLAIALISIAA